MRDYILLFTHLLGRECVCMYVWGEQYSEQHPAGLSLNCVVADKRGTQYQFPLCVLLIGRDALPIHAFLPCICLNSV